MNYILARRVPKYRMHAPVLIGGGHVTQAMQIDVVHVTEHVNYVNWYQHELG